LGVNLISNRSKFRIFLILITVAVSLRIGLAWYNTEANDDHMEIIRLILEKEEAPRITDCWQCYHPKLYHYTNAFIFKSFEISNPLTQTHIAQYLNVIAGSLTLLILYLFIIRLPFSNLIQILSWALMALNPKFMGINVQATNDSFAILFSTGAFWFLFLFLKTGRWRLLLAVLPLAILSALAKGSGIATLLAVELALIAALFIHLHKKVARNAALIGLVVFPLMILMVYPFSDYKRNADDKGSPLAFNIPKLPFPNLIQETHLHIAGVSSLTESLLTFRIFDMIETPYIIGTSEHYLKARTSLWAQVYGRFIYAQYDNHPGAWQPKLPYVHNLGRALLILGLLPLGFLIIGTIAIPVSGVLALKRRRFKIWFKKSRWFPFFIAMSFILMLIKLNIDFRAYYAMKAIYLFPALLGFLWLTAYGMHLCFKSLQRTPYLQNLFIGLFILLLALQTLSMTGLLQELGHSYAARSMHLVYQDKSKSDLQLNPDQVLLTDLPRLYHQQDWGTLGINQSTDKHPLVINGKKYHHGFGIHAYSRTGFKLDKKYAAFQVSMGMDDEVLSIDGVRFQIRIDRKVVYTSKVAMPYDLQHIELDVSDADILMLEVLPLSNNISDHGNWINPILRLKSE
jgi:hypothetical protein